MAHVPDAHRASSNPLALWRASNLRPWNLAHPARLAGFVLLLVWVGPVTLVQTDTWHLLRFGPGRASAESGVIPAGEAILLEPGTPLKLYMRNGKVIKGRFLGRTLLDSALYAPRFAEKTRTSKYAPFAMGESLHVSLRDGREWAAPFAGYAELTLLLRSPDGQYMRVPFEYAREVRRANGDRVEPRALTRAFRRGSLPSAEALALEQLLPVGSEADRWAGALRLAVDDIESATAKIASNYVPLIIVLSVAAIVVLLVLAIRSSIGSAFNSCGSAVGSTPKAMSGVHLTTRPFDRDRGCYVGDPLAVADPGPGPTDGGPATALADPAASH